MLSHSLHALELEGPKLIVCPETEQVQRALEDAAERIAPLSANPEGLDTQRLQGLLRERKNLQQLQASGCFEGDARAELMRMNDGLMIQVDHTCANLTEQLPQRSNMAANSETFCRAIQHLCDERCP